MMAPDTPRRLAGAASYLCCAERELRSAGYATWHEQLADLIRAIDLELATLENIAESDRSAGLAP